MWNRRAAIQPPAYTVIKTFRAEQPLLGPCQWFNEIRALIPEQKVVYTPKVHISNTLPLPWFVPSPNNNLLLSDPPQMMDAFGNSWTSVFSLWILGEKNQLSKACSNQETLTYSSVLIQALHSLSMPLSNTPRINLHKYSPPHGLWDSSM